MHQNLTRQSSSGALSALIVVSAAAFSALAAETLYNGIQLPSEWPPRNQPVNSQPPDTPPYLLSSPAVIPIDVGRQLFVDYFLIEETTLRRKFHAAQYYRGNPVLRPDKPWEATGPKRRQAMSFSDGVWYDPQAHLFKAWYVSGPATLYATSKDGVHWEKPQLDVEPGTNIVHKARRDSSTVWLDLEEKDPSRRYKFAYSNGNEKPVSLYYSADGIHWGSEVARSLPAGDRTTVFWNPFRKVWVISLRDSGPGAPGNAQRYKIPGNRVRLRSYIENPDLAAAIKWKESEPVKWVGADRLDPGRIDLGAHPELYNVDAVAYESVMLGLFSIWRGQPDREVRDKPNEVTVGFSRDGFHWMRPYRTALIAVSEQPEAWNHSNVQSVGGVCLVVGDRLYLYCSGRAGAPLGPGDNSTGLATLRRDGFVSMDAGDAGGSLTTRPVRFKGRYLFVNVDAADGELRVEALDSKSRVIAPFSLDNCLPIHSNNTLQEVRWKGSADLAALAGTPMKFRFHLRAGSIYAFWVSPDRSGASHGYVAAGGPGFTGPIDTVGSAIYEHCCATDELN
jgi:hypothetical protein